MIGPKQVGKSTIIERNLKQARDKSGVLYEDESGNRGTFLRFVEYMSWDTAEALACDCDAGSRLLRRQFQRMRHRSNYRNPRGGHGHSEEYQ